MTNDGLVLMAYVPFLRLSYNLGQKTINTIAPLTSNFRGSVYLSKLGKFPAIVASFFLAFNVLTNKYLSIMMNINVFYRTGF